MLTVYVDDLKLSGPKKNLSRGWELLSSVLDLEPEGPQGRKVDRYLGCKHEITVEDIVGVGKVRVMTYNMEEYLQAITNDFAEHMINNTSRKTFKMSIVRTPFSEEDHRNAPARAPNEGAGISEEKIPSNKEQSLLNGSLGGAAAKPIATGGLRASQRWGQYKPQQPDWDIHEVCALAPTKKKNKKRAKSLPPPLRISDGGEMPMSERGELQSVAASFIMRLLYSARYARFDLLRAIARLASFIHFWDKDCDERLIKLMK